MIIFTVATKAKKVWCVFFLQETTLLTISAWIGNAPTLPRWQTVDTHGIDEKGKYQWNFGN
jgi:hypothetical protein